jgi:hypothetical protein
MNRIIHVCTTTLLLTFATVMVANNRSSADPNPAPTPSPTPGIVAPQGKDLIAKFECRSRGPSTGEILLRANGKYTVQQKKGNYYPTRRGYRFITGSLKGQSIVRQKGNIYLVSTQNEARAAELAAADGALFCTGGEIKY